MVKRAEGNHMNGGQKMRYLGTNVLRSNSRCPVPQIVLPVQLGSRGIYGAGSRWEHSFARMKAHLLQARWQAASEDIAFYTTLASSSFRRLYVDIFTPRRSRSAGQTSS